jgi:hemolysin-activating ACP:hemolysin acyltransferase
MDQNRVFPGISADSFGLRLFRPAQSVTALGLAVDHLMTKPAFASLPFGEWSRILVGQINRGHYVFAVDSTDRIQGFVGWGLITRTKAEAWVEGRYVLSYTDCLEGDCVIFNAWSANSTSVHRFLVDAARKLVMDRETVYFRRHYKDGSWRPVRLKVNDFVGGHISRKESQNRTAAPDAQHSLNSGDTGVKSGRDLPNRGRPTVAMDAPQLHAATRV